MCLNKDTVHMHMKWNVNNYIWPRLAYMLNKPLNPSVFLRNLKNKLKQHTYTHTPPPSTLGLTNKPTPPHHSSKLPTCGKHYTEYPEYWYISITSNAKDDIQKRSWYYHHNTGPAQSNIILSTSQEPHVLFVHWLAWSLALLFSCSK